MALLLYFRGNFNTSLTAKGDTEMLEKINNGLAELPPEKRWAVFESVPLEEGGKSVKITIFNPVETLSHVIEEDEEELKARILEQKRRAQLAAAQGNAGLIDLPRGH